MTSFEEIVEYINERYPQQKNYQLKNCSDQNFAIQQSYVYQYIMGVISTDGYSRTVDSYKFDMSQRLGKALPNHDCVPFPFATEETEELKDVLIKLSEYFDADLNIEKMLQQLRSESRKSNLNYIMITVVQITTIFAE